jgi:PAS domain S-box-containing protein
MAHTRDRGIDVLVVDGSAAFAADVEAALTRQSAVRSVESTGSVVEAVRSMRSGSVDAVVCGPVGDGWPVRRLRQEADVPVVALLDDVDDDSIARAVEAGATDYFSRTAADAQWSLVASRLHELVSNRDAAESYRELFEVAGDSISVHDPETGEMLDANDRLVGLLGYDRERLLDEGVALISSEEHGFDAERAREVVRAAADGDGDDTVEWALETVDGETVWVESTLEVGDIGGQRRVISVSRDITERKRLQRELEESERRFRQMAERIDQIVYLTTGDLSEVLYVNPAYESLYGRPVDELYEDSFAFIDGIHPEDRESYLADLEAMLDDVERGEPADSYTFEFRVRRPDGTVRHAQADGYPIQREDGDDRFVGVVEDVTERRRREREREELFESVSDGLVVHDPETGEMLDVNERFCELTGYDREELIGEGVGLVVAEDEGYTFERAQERIESAREEGPQLFEWREERKSGEQYPVEVHLDVATVDGEERVLASVRDITERKRRERELEATERRFRRITENVDEVVFNSYGVVSVPKQVYDEPPEEAEIDYLSPAFEDLWGRPVEDVYDDPGVFYEGVHPDDRDAFVEATARMARDERRGTPEDSYDVEFRVVQPDGTVRWASASAYPVELHDADVFYWVGIIEDVTERRRQQRRLEAVAERVDEVIRVASPDLSEVLYVSPGYEDLWGRPVEELDDDPLAFLDHVLPEDRPAVRERVERVRETAASPDADVGDDSHRYEFRIERPDGEVRWLETTGYPVTDAEGQVYRYVTLTRDVTGENAREGMLESLHDATRQLSEAETATDACGTAVRAATDLLELGAVAAYRYDDGDGRLVPVAATPRDAEDLPAFEPGENRPWRAFVDGQAASTNGEADPDLPGVDDELAFPLGEHGVFVVGDDRLDTDDFEAAQILAARLEAGLNHVEGRREVRERERDLRAETERADRLARLNDVIRDIEAAVVEESTRDGVERTVCRRLVGGDAYELAWVGEPDVGGRSLTVRNRAGDDDRPGVPVDVVVDESPPESHPAWQAVETGEFQYVDNIVGAEVGQWRRQALNRGYQSCCAIPLAHDDRVRGVLMLYAAEPDAFTERERRVLDELGRTIGYAVTTIERRRALESDSTVELEFSVEDPGLYVVEFAELVGAPVRHERAVRRSDGTVGLFCTVEADEAAAESLAEARTVESVSTVSERDGRVVVEATTDAWFGTPFAEDGAVVRSAYADDSEGRVLVDLPRTADVRAVAERFHDAYGETELVAKRETEGWGRTLPELQTTLEARLTDRQREVLETAYSAGYFEWPRDSSGQEVAERLDITQPTFNRHLRIAEAETFSLVLDDDDGNDADAT